MRKIIAKSLVSVLVLAVFVIPMLLSIRWVSGLINSRDQRQVVYVEPLKVRQIDQTTQPLKPLAEPLISISFDDGWGSVYSEALPVLQTSGFATTQYIISGILNNRSYMSVDQVKSMQKAGHEVAGHTINHVDLTMLDDEQLTRQLADSKQALEKDFGPIRDFTSPYGAYNSYTLKQISKYYRSQKNAEGDPAANDLEAINVSSSSDPLNFVSYSVRKTTILDDLKRLVTAAQTHNGWLVLTYHQIDYSGETFSVTPEDFKQQMDYLSKVNIRSATVGQVMDILLANPRAGN